MFQSVYCEVCFSHAALLLVASPADWLEVTGVRSELHPSCTSLAHGIRVVLASHHNNVHMLARIELAGDYAVPGRSAVVDW